MPNVRKFLDLSTSHLRQNVFNEMTSFVSVIAYEFSEGAFLHVPDDVDETVAEYSEDHPIPAEIVNIWRYARRLACDYVLFDADAPVDPALPRWDW